MQNQHPIPVLAALPLILCASLAGCSDALPTEPMLEPSTASALAAPNAQSAVPRVQAAGQVRVTDENGDGFSARVAIVAETNRKGRTVGSVNMVFDREFSAVWGAEPGIQRIHLRGAVTSTIRDGGKVVLSGTLTETDVAEGGRKLVFPNEPFEIEITGPGRFTLVWCELPPFDVEMAAGQLIY